MDNAQSTMAEDLQLPPNICIHKRKRSDLGIAVAQERRDVRGMAVQSNSRWVRKAIGQRSTYQCWFGGEKQALKQGLCRVCGHETMKGSEHLAECTSKIDSAREPNNGTVSIIHGKLDVISDRLADNRESRRSNL